MKSIRTFLLAAVSLVVISITLLSVLIGFYKASYETDELFDAELAQTARILRSTLNVSRGYDSAKASPSVEIVSTHDWLPAPEIEDSEIDERTSLGHSYERKILFRVQYGSKVLIESDNSQLKPEMALDPGYQTVEAEGFKWYLFSLQDGNTIYTVGERSDVREEVARKIAFSSLYPSLLALPVLLLLFAWALQRGLRPLVELDQNIQQRDKDNLDPISALNSPVEIAPIVESLNGLLVRLRRSLEGERRFTATASHEMRTPIAVLKVNVQNALKTQDEHERLQFLQDLNVGVDRAGRLINQLLTLSRLEQDDPGFIVQKIDIMPVLREEIASLYPLAEQRKLSLELIAEEGEMMLATVPQIFPLVIRNLVDNAIKYAPDGGAVKVRVDRQPGGFLLRVDDSGQGVPSGERQKVFERFYRVQSVTAPGSGLGLAIVKRVVELLNGTITADSSADLGGLSVQVFFPE